ncbi:hypothetical protein BKA64DRAFT_443619 [Cadophora sp. MPI-SDFR-AT-0126]|nr:hypothetical protein BKA64DRAFT_443619 [Leotiomycetes sp. MPI-SDFR-AT-0126]
MEVVMFASRILGLGGCQQELLHLIPCLPQHHLNQTSTKMASQPPDRPVIPDGPDGPEMSDEDFYRLFQELRRRQMVPDVNIQMPPAPPQPVRAPKMGPRENIRNQQRVATAARKRAKLIPPNANAPCCKCQSDWHQYKRWPLPSRSGFMDEGCLKCNETGHLFAACPYGDWTVSEEWHYIRECRGGLAPAAHIRDWREIMNSDTGSLDLSTNLPLSSQYAKENYDELTTKRVRDPVWTPETLEDIDGTRQVPSEKSNLFSEETINEWQFLVQRSQRESHVRMQPPRAPGRPPPSHRQHYETAQSLRVPESARDFAAPRPYGIGMPSGARVILNVHNYGQGAPATTTPTAITRGTVDEWLKTSDPDHVRIPSADPPGAHRSALTIGGESPPRRNDTHDSEVSRRKRARDTEDTDDSVVKSRRRDTEDSVVNARNRRDRDTHDSVVSHRHRDTEDSVVNRRGRDTEDSVVEYRSRRDIDTEDSVVNARQRRYNRDTEDSVVNARRGDTEDSVVSARRRRYSDTEDSVINQRRSAQGRELSWATTTSVHAEHNTGFEELSWPNPHNNDDSWSPQRERSTHGPNQEPTHNDRRDRERSRSPPSPDPVTGWRPWPKIGECLICYSRHHVAKHCFQNYRYKTSSRELGQIGKCFACADSEHFAKYCPYNTINRPPRKKRDRSRNNGGPSGGRDQESWGNWSSRT